MNHTVITNKIKPESLCVVRHEGVITNSIPSQAFCLENQEMRIKRRLKRNPDTQYCECGCGQIVISNRRFIIGHFWLGKKLSDETKRKIGLKSKGRKHTEEAKRKIGLAFKGRILNENQKRALLLANLGKHCSEETKRKLSIANTGRNLSDEIRKKISKSNMGRIVSEETRRKIGLGNKGKVRTEEIKKKLSLVHTGEKHSKEQVIKQAISQMRCRIDGYCDAWSDNDYKKECRKDYCELCSRKKVDSWQLQLHHINLNSLDCRPINFITLCVSCHSSLHKKLNKINNKVKAKSEHFIILTKEDKIQYIHKETRQKVEIVRKVVS